VDEDDVRRIRGVDPLHAVRLQQACSLLGVVDVHLAAERLDEVLPRRHIESPSYARVSAAGRRTRPINSSAFISAVPVTTAPASMRATSRTRSRPSISRTSVIVRPRTTLFSTT